MNAALAAGKLVGFFGLRNAALDRVGNQLFMPFAPRLAFVGLRYQIAVAVVTVGIHARESANPARCRPGARAFAVGYGYALAAFDERQHFTAGDNKTVEGFHAGYLFLGIMMIIGRKAGSCQHLYLSQSFDNL